MAEKRLLIHFYNFFYFIVLHTICRRWHVVCKPDKVEWNEIQTELLFKMEVIAMLLSKRYPFWDIERTLEEMNRVFDMFRAGWASQHAGRNVSGVERL